MKALNLKTLAQFGCSARAAVYFLMGLLALLLVTGSQQGKVSGPKGAISSLLEKPFGKGLLALLAFGLFSYSFWRFAQSFLARSPSDSKLKRAVHRVGYALGGVGHGLLGIYALQLLGLYHSGSGTSENSERTWVHWLLTKPFGQGLTLAVALCIFGFGVSQFVSSWKQKYEKRISIPRQQKGWLHPVCKFGLASRGFVFLLIGSFFMKAAISFNSREAGGIAKAWTVLRHQPFGDYLIAIMGFGFVAFAIYSLMEALYMKSELPA